MNYPSQGIYERSLKRRIVRGTRRRRKKTLFIITLTEKIKGFNGQRFWCPVLGSEALIFDTLLVLKETPKGSALHSKGVNLTPFW